MKSKFVICFGEVLWDNLPSGRVPGGAPLNVAYHLSKLGIEVSVISSVGNDNNGRDLLETIEKMGLSTEHCLLNSELPTSTVEVHLSDSEDVKYTIVSPVAWDNVEWKEEFSNLSMESDALVFGSLSGRSPGSRKVLERLLDKNTYKVFDVNLRAPFYDRDYIFWLLQKTDLVKLNQNELSLILAWLGKKKDGDVAAIFDSFPVSEILLTKGAEGANYYNKEDSYFCPAINVEVMDTIGSGDSFLAGFLANRLSGQKIETSMAAAASLSAFVTSMKGSCPQYQLNDILPFMNEFEELSGLRIEKIT